MTDFVYNPVVFDYDFRKNDVGKAEWLLKQEVNSNIYYPDIGIDKNILTNTDTPLTTQAINSYFSQYLIKFGLSSAVSNKEDFEKIQGILTLEFDL